MGDILPIERHSIVLGSVYFTTQFVSKNGRLSLDLENVFVFENLALLYSIVNQVNDNMCKATAGQKDGFNCFISLSNFTSSLY